jgi:hypothetical protein
MGDLLETLAIESWKFNKKKKHKELTSEGNLPTPQRINCSKLQMCASVVIGSCDQVLRS